MSAAREQEYYVAVKDANRQIWDGINTLISLQREWNSLDYGTTLDDGEGGNVPLTKTEITAVVNTTANAFVTLLGDGHGTNMAKLL